MVASCSNRGFCLSPLSGTCRPSSASYPSCRLCLCLPHHHHRLVRNARPPKQCQTPMGHPLQVRPSRPLAPPRGPTVRLALSMGENKATYYVALGPHGPWTPVSPPRKGPKVLLSTLSFVGVAALIAWGVHARGGCLCSARLVHVDWTLFVAPPPPKTLTREWQEASNGPAREQKLAPITGASPHPRFSVHAHSHYPQVSRRKVTRARVLFRTSRVMSCYRTLSLSLLHVSS